MKILKLSNILFIFKKKALLPYKGYFYRAGDIVEWANHFSEDLKLDAQKRKIVWASVTPVQRDGEEKQNPWTLWAQLAWPTQQKQRNTQSQARQMARTSTGSYPLAYTHSTEGTYMHTHLHTNLKKINTHPSNSIFPLWTNSSRRCP